MLGNIYVLYILHITTQRWKVPEDFSLQVWVARTEPENTAIHHRNPALIPAALLNQGLLEGT